MDNEMTSHINGESKEKSPKEFSEKDPLKELKEDLSIKAPTTFKENFQFVVKNITVEPTMLLFVLSCILTMMTAQNLNIEKACRVNLNFGDEICQSLKLQQLESMNEHEREAQKLVARAMTWRTYLTATIPCILAIFVGSWSDKTGHRKVFIIIPLAGQILTCINSIINVYFFHQLSLEVIVFSDAIIEAFTGGWCIMFITVFSYISAITNEDTRTFRMGMLNFSLTVGFPIGMGISGILLKKFGYYGCYGLALCLHTINILYNAFVLKDPVRNSEQKQHDRRGIFYCFKMFFNLTNFKETYMVVFKKGPNKRRLRMCVLLSIVSVLFGPMYGEITIMYLSTRYRFNWNEVKFSMFQAYNFVTHTLGTIFSITVFSKYLQWHDSILGIISTLSKIAGSFVYCFAPNEKIFFLAPLVEVLNGTSLLAIRSIISKLVAPNELGKVNSIFGLTENLMPLVYVPLYTKVYTSTMEVLPGAVFLMGAAMTLPAVAIFICLLYEHRRGVSKSKKEYNGDISVGGPPLLGKSPTSDKMCLFG